MSHKVAATQLRCGGMFSNHFSTNFSQNAAVKKFWKSVNIWQRYGKNFVAYFLGHPVYTQQYNITESLKYLDFILETLPNSIARLYKQLRWSENIYRPTCLQDMLLRELHCAEFSE